MRKKRQKITYIVFLLLAALARPLQAVQPTLEDHKTRDDHHQAFVDLFKISGIGLQIIKYIGCDGRDGQTALYWSIGFGYITYANDLIKQNATKDKWGHTALHRSILYGHLACVKYLVDKKVDIHAKDNHGNTALILGAKVGRIDCVKYLVKKGAITSENVNKALFWSAFNGHVDIVKYLVQRGAAIDMQDLDKFTALGLSDEKGPLDCLKYIVEQCAK